MKPILLTGSAALVFAIHAPAAAQHADHTATQPAAPAQQPIDHSQHQTGHGAHTQGTTPPAPSPQADRSVHQNMDHSAHAAAPDHAAMGHDMTGALGPYPMSREASGSAWQPDTSEHMGLQTMSGGWTLMGHALLNGVYSWQEGPRGDDETFVSGMVMGMARRDFSNGNTLQFKAMLSPDPLMGKSGYPLHLASGETANGVDILVDRQHPHDLFMELSASYSVRLSDKSSVFLYGGLPGEPAFGPPAFMHRMSIMDSPEAPISHHWLDSTHITFGVLTAGFVYDRFKIEASRFNGREPDQHRYNIETGPLDSTAVRLSLNPTGELSLQASWADLKEPEQLAPGEDQTKWSASAIYTRPVAGRGWWSSTLAWGRRSGDHEQFDALAFESAVSLDNWTLFGRAERTENNELVSDHGHHGPTYKVGKVSFGAIRDFDIAPHVKFGVGGLYALNFVPNALETLYDGDPQGAMAFVRLKIQ